jgi:hypothetical protein
MRLNENEGKREFFWKFLIKKSEKVSFPLIRNKWIRFFRIQFRLYFKMTFRKNFRFDLIYIYKAFGFNIGIAVEKRIFAII